MTWQVAQRTALPPVPRARTPCAGAMAADSLDEVPVVDLATMSAAEAASVLDAALRRYGFFYVSGHGIPEELIAQQFAVSAEVFALPAAVKEAMPFDPFLDIGYQCPGSQQLDASGTPVHGDTKEAFLMTNNALLSDPAHVPSADDPFAGAKLHRPPVAAHEAVTRAFVAAAGALNARLNALLFDAMGLAEAERAALGSRPFMVLKQMRYQGEISRPELGKLGAGAHADWGAFTILATDATPGLQVTMGEGVWLPVPPRKGCLIINSGDQIAQLSNDSYRSAVHRVVTVSTTPRFSTAVFTYFNLEAEVAPLPRFVAADRPARHPFGRTTLQYFHYKLHESIERGGGYAAPAAAA